MSRPATLGELRESGWESRPIKDELRENAIARIAAGEPLVEGVLGYEDTVLPQLENALLAGHDVIFLGERGQAKTRMIRSLTNLLDEWMPIVAGSEINDDPYAPVSHHARLLVAERAAETPIEWVHRDRRFGEKLATPDTSIADLIGEVDPIKVAEGRYLSDELTIHYGLVPRTNRGIFAINELPDLAERIQVGLLNILEERDVQIRGYKIQLPIDVMLLASANPEDYTNRGRIITPLKDRFGSQIRTHYPLDVDIEMDVIDQEARIGPVGDRVVTVPDFMTEIVAEVSQQARRSPHVNQRSGVSVRLSVSNYETLVANATRRALRNGEHEIVPRISDLDSLVSSSAGKIEIETVDDGREGQVLDRIVKTSVLEVFRATVPTEKLGGLVSAFEDGRVVHTGADVPSAEYADLLGSMSGLRDALGDLGVGETPAGVASAVEFVLEGLHLSKRLNKDSIGGKTTYRSRGDRPVVSEPTASELRATVDEVAIRGLIAEYADVVNRRAWPELAEIFEPDAPVQLELRDRAPLEFVGPEAIGAFIAEAIERFPFFEFVALNVRVLRDDDAERARVRTYMCELRQDHAGTPSRAYGLYQDEVVRTPGGWRFARRHYQSIARGEQGLDLMPPPEIL